MKPVLRVQLRSDSMNLSEPQLVVFTLEKRGQKSKGAIVEGATKRMYRDTLIVLFKPYWQLIFLHYLSESINLRSGTVCFYFPTLFRILL